MYYSVQCHPWGCTPDASNISNVKENFFSCYNWSVLPYAIVAQPCWPWPRYIFRFKWGNTKIELFIDSDLKDTDNEGGWRQLSHMHAPCLLSCIKYAQQASPLIFFITGGHMHLVVCLMYFLLYLVAFSAIWFIVYYYIIINTSPSHPTSLCTFTKCIIPIYSWST